MILNLIIFQHQLQSQLYHLINLNLNLIIIHIYLLFFLLVPFLQKNNLLTILYVLLYMELLQIFYIIHLLSIHQYTSYIFLIMFLKKINILFLLNLILLLMIMDLIFLLYIILHNLILKQHFYFITFFLFQILSFQEIILHNLYNYLQY